MSATDSVNPRVVFVRSDAPAQQQSAFDSLPTTKKAQPSSAFDALPAKQADKTDSTAASVLAGQGTAVQEKEEFTSYGVSAARWGWEAFKFNHDNITDYPILSVIRRFAGAIIGFVGAVFGLVLDAFRGMAYKLPKEFKLHNNGTAPMKPLLARAFQWFQPTRDIAKAAARNIVDAFDVAGKAVNDGRLNGTSFWHETQPQHALEKTVAAEAAVLAPRLAGLGADEQEKIMRAFYEEMVAQTKDAPDYYPIWGNGSQAVNKAQDGLLRLQTQLQSCLATEIAQQAVGKNGKVDARKLTSVIDQWESSGVIPEGANRSDITEAAKAIERGTSPARKETSSTPAGAGSDPSDVAAKTKADSPSAGSGWLRSLNPLNLFRTSSTTANPDFSGAAAKTKTDSPSTGSGLLSRLNPLNLVKGSQPTTAATDAHEARVKATAAEIEAEKAEKVKKVTSATANLDGALALLKQITDLQGQIIQIDDDIKIFVEDRTKALAEFPAEKERVRKELSKQGINLDTILLQMSLGNKDAKDVLPEAARVLKEQIAAIQNDREIATRVERREKLVGQLASLKERLEKQLKKLPDQSELSQLGVDKGKVREFNELNKLMAKNDQAIAVNQKKILEKGGLVDSLNEKIAKQFAIKKVEFKGPEKKPHKKSGSAFEDLEPAAAAGPSLVTTLWNLVPSRPAWLSWSSKPAAESAFDGLPPASAFDRLPVK